MPNPYANFEPVEKSDLFFGYAKAKDTLYQYINQSISSSRQEDGSSYNQNIRKTDRLTIKILEMRLSQHDACHVPHTENKQEHDKKKEGPTTLKINC